MKNSLIEGPDGVWRILNSSSSCSVARISLRPANHVGRVVWCVMLDREWTDKA